ncbi:hypothetical protein JCM11641_004425 [Rhodosporidiobolus odoratus]
MAANGRAELDVQEGLKFSPQAPPLALAGPPAAAAAPHGPSTPASAKAHNDAAEHRKMLTGASQEYYKVGGFQLSVSLDSTTPLPSANTPVSPLGSITGSHSKDGPASRVKSRIVFATSAVASVTLSVLHSAADSLHSNCFITSNTTRLSIPTRTTKAGSAHNTLVNEVKHTLVKHFSGSAILPAISRVVFPTSSPLHTLVSRVAGARFQGFIPDRGTSPLYLPY